MGNRKDTKTGKIIDWEFSKATPRYIETKDYTEEEIVELKLLA